MYFFTFCYKYFFNCFCFCFCFCFFFLLFYFCFYYVFIFATWVLFNGVCWLILQFTIFSLLKIVVVFLQRDEEKFYMTRLLELGLVETVDKKNITSGSPSGKSYSLSLFPFSSLPGEVERVWFKTSCTVAGYFVTFSSCCQAVTVLIGGCATKASPLPYVSCTRNQ